MSAKKKVIRYMQTGFNEVLHTTLNPEGPGVVRIHLVPPEYDDGELKPSIAIINGQDIIPVNYSWTILLAEFIKEVNKYHGVEITDKDAKSIIDNTAKAVRKVFFLLPKSIIKKDIFTIMNAFKQVAYGEEVDEEIGYMNIGEYAEFMKAPHRMDIMVSAMTKDGKWHCNQQCVHCYAAGQVHAEEKELTTEEWIAILDKLRAIGIPQVTFTGGEPTMRDDLFELIDHARWFVSRLNTNGIKLTDDYCKKLREVELDSVQITFYSSDEEIHNKLVGAPQYANTVNGIKNAIANDLNLSINTPLCTLNKDYVKTLEFLKDLGVNYVTCSGLITTGNATTEASENLQLTTDEIKKILADAADYCYANGMEISFTSPGWIENEFFDEHALSIPNCGACLSNMAVTPSGIVVPCQSWLSDDALGNILTDEWSDIWNNKTAVARREYSAEMLGKCPLRQFKVNVTTDEKKDLNNNAGEENNER